MDYKQIWISKGEYIVKKSSGGRLGLDGWKITKKISQLSTAKKMYIMSAVFPMAIMLVVWMFMGVFPFGTKSLMAVDFGQQYIGLYGFLKETILTGDWSGLFYSFSKSLGGAMIGVWGFNLLSPFNIFYVLTPLTEFKWAIFLSIWIRYGAMGLSFAYLLIKRYRGEETKNYLVPILATAYALSGMIVSYQMNPIFYDAMVMLPLIIVALERLIDEKRYIPYISLLALMILMHFYMGYMICLFIALYSLYYATTSAVGQTWPERLRGYIAPLLRVVGASLVAVLLSAVMFLPIVLNLIRSKGAYNYPLTFDWRFQINPLDILSKLVVGSFDNNSWAHGPQLPNIFVGALALSGCLLYFASKSIPKERKIGAALVFLIFFLSVSHEFTSKIWHMGQNPAGFFYRFSWLISFFMVLLAFQAFQKQIYFGKTKLIVSLLGIVAVIAYLTTKKFTYIGQYQPSTLTIFVRNNALIVQAIFVIFALGLVYYVFKKLHSEKTIKAILSISILVAAGGVYYILRMGLLFTQLSITLIAWILVVALYFYRPKVKSLWLVISIFTSLELGYNAYLSQSKINYDDAYKFSDATDSIKEVTDYIKQLDDDSFYRVASTFYYGRNDPFLLGYNGLSTFSSNTEKSTIDLFSHLGNVGGDASTFYANGTQLTDSLFGVRYYIDAKPYTSQDVKDNPKKRYFEPVVTRTDLQNTYTKIYETDRYILYENKNVFSIGFGTNYETANIKFEVNNPVANQNLILSSMSGEKKDYFKIYLFEEILTNNLTELKGAKGKIFYTADDKTKAASLKLKARLKTDNTYYVLAPYNLRKSKGNIGIKLNDKWYRYTQSYDQTQLWNIASRQKDEEINFSLDIYANRNSADSSLPKMEFVRAADSDIAKVLSERKKQELIVTSWGNTFINGKTNITDSSTVMLTSIPYNPGWEVKVDGKVVQTSEAWGSLLSFPITKGEHKIEMNFTPQGWYLGLGISSLTLIGLISLIIVEKRRKK